MPDYSKLLIFKVVHVIEKNSSSKKTLVFFKTRTMTETFEKENFTEKKTILLIRSFEFVEKVTESTELKI
jgi:hypothetical protein